MASLWHQPFLPGMSDAEFDGGRGLYERDLNPPTNALKSKSSQKNSEYHGRALVNHRLML